MGMFKGKKLWLKRYILNQGFEKLVVDAGREPKKTNFTRPG